MRYILAAGSMRRYANIRTVLSEGYIEHANQLDAESSTYCLLQNGHSWSFKIIYFDVNEKPLSDCCSTIIMRPCILKFGRYSERRKRKLPF